MAKYERKLTGDFSTFLGNIQEGILRGSASAHLEDGSDFSAGGVRCATRVFERYSIFGGNRVSLSVTLFGNDNELHLSAISAGGSQAMFFKVNRVGENTFLGQLIKLVDEYSR
jgi:hypothetical protein